MQLVSRSGSVRILMWDQVVLSRVLTHIQLAGREGGGIAPIPIVVEFE